MGMVAVGAYLRTLREGRKLGREKIAAQIGTSSSNLERIEKDGQEPRIGLVGRFLDAVQGSMEDVQQLLLDDAATVEDGERLAQSRLTPPERAVVEQTVSEHGADRVLQALNLMQSLSRQELMDLMLRLQSNREQQER